MKVAKMSFQCLVVLMMFLWSVQAFATETVGGPYTADEHTVLLLHFDGNLTNESQYSADAVAHGTTSFYSVSARTGLGSSIYVNNGSKSDSSYISVADTAALDLTGSWTIEGWINIFTFGESSDDWRWVPRLAAKAGDDVWYQNNFFIEMWGDTRMYSCGYNVDGTSNWPQVNSPDYALEVGAWRHITFIRDTVRCVLIQLTHDASLNLVDFNVSSFDPITDNPPRVNSNPVTMGYAGGGGDSWLDGFLDEVRISNVVREFPIPPIVTNVTEMNNQTSEATSYEVGANIYSLFSTPMQSATLYYNIGSGWQQVAMTTVGTDSMSAAIPQQPAGSIVKYYVKAVDTDGLSFTQPQDAEDVNGTYYTFGIYTPQTQTLGLSFEEGSGVPQDASTYGQTVTVVGAPEYSTDAVVGTKSIYLEGDSSYLEIDSPFLTSEEFCVDFWLKADSIIDYCRILNRPSDASSYSNNSYQIRFNNTKKIQAMADSRLTLTSTITVEANTWYHVIFEVKKAAEGDTCGYYGAFEVLNAQNERISYSTGVFDTPVNNAMAPLRIGKAAGGTYPAYFKGYIDDVKIYNYPVAGINPNAVKESNVIPSEYILSQNYPNPFNPTTQIHFSIPRNQMVSLVVYDVLGRKVKSLLDSKMPAGQYNLTWDAKNDYGLDVASGIYFYTLKSDNCQKVKKMILMR